MNSDPITVATAESEMREGEKLLWSGKPDPIRACTSGLRYWALAIPL